MREPEVMKLRDIYIALQELTEKFENQRTLTNAQSVFNKAEEFAQQYTSVLGPSHFMLRLNQESLNDYKVVQDWSYNTQNRRNWALGAYLLLSIGGGKSLNVEEARKKFNNLTSQMTPINGTMPSFSIALHIHGQEVPKD